jgi:hypothetical protein
VALKGGTSETCKNFANIELKNIINILTKTIKGYHLLFWLLHETVTFSVNFEQQQKTASIEDSLSQYFSIQP